MARTLPSDVTARGLKREQAIGAKRIERAELAELRRRVDAARRTRARKLASLRRIIRKARARLAQEIKAFRAKWRAWVNAEVEQMRARARARHAAGLRRLAELHDTKIARARAELEERRRLYRSVRESSAWRRDQLKRGHRTAFESKEHSDEEVENNRPPELRDAWRHFRNKIKTRVPGKTRTEAFIEWVSENEEDVAAWQASREVTAEDWAALQAAEAAAHHDRPRRRRKRAELEEAPF